MTGGPYNQGCASEVNGCLASLVILLVAVAVIGSALHALGVL